MKDINQIWINLAEMRSICKVLAESPKSTHQGIRWNYGIYAV